MRSQCPVLVVTLLLASSSIVAGTFLHAKAAAHRPTEVLHDDDDGAWEENETGSGSQDEDEGEDEPETGARAAKRPSCGQTPALDKLETLRGGGGESRIIRGTDQLYGEFPSFVNLRDPQGQVQCGGTLISRRHLLTAAHCLRGNSTAEGWRALLGPYRPYASKNQQQQRQSDSNAEVAIKARVCLAPGYNFKRRARRDWVVLELATEAQLNAHVQPACLPGGNSPRARHNATACWLVGTGAIAFAKPNGKGAKLPEKVQRLRMQQRSCTYERLNREARVCYAPTAPATAGNSSRPRAGMCYGDSGGPVLCWDQAPARWTLAAVASGGLTDLTCDFFRPPAASWQDRPQLFVEVWGMLEEMRRECSWMGVP